VEKDIQDKPPGCKAVSEAENKLRRGEAQECNIVYIQYTIMEDILINDTSGFCIGYIRWQFALFVQNSIRRPSITVIVPVIIILVGFQRHKRVPLNPPVFEC